METKELTIKNDPRKYAIYSRKSKFTGKGESIENQIELCKQFLNSKFEGVSEDELLVFEDEGYSGKNTNRPEFQKMLKAIRNNEVKIVADDLVFFYVFVFPVARIFAVVAVVAQHKITKLQWCLLNLKEKQ